MIEGVITILASLTLLGNLLAVLLLGVLFIALSNPKKGFGKRIVHLISENTQTCGFVIASIATMGSLFLSEIAGFNPCQLCWYQRIFMYPLVFIFGVSLFINDTKVGKYVMPLALVGFSISAYHYMLQSFPTVLKCTDEVARCTLKQTASFGFITIPYMAGTAFLLIILLLLIQRASARFTLIVLGSYVAIQLFTYLVFQYI